MKALLAAAALLAVVAFASAASPEENSSGACRDAAVWHRQMALRTMNPEEVHYHLEAAQAADELAAMQADCGNWKEGIPTDLRS